LPLYELAAEELHRPSITDGKKQQKRLIKGKGKSKAKDGGLPEPAVSSSSSTIVSSSTSPSSLAPVEVALPDVPSAQAFREILYFIYTDEVCTSNSPI
jgi:hypothetical protein